MFCWGFLGPWVPWAALAGPGGAQGHLVVGKPSPGCGSASRARQQVALRRRRAGGFSPGFIFLSATSSFPPG